MRAGSVALSVCTPTVFCGWVSGNGDVRPRKVQSSVHTVCVGWFGPDLSVPTFIPDWAGYDMVHGADLFLIFVDFK